jgi:hypothetical protein|tara:strand:+ start:1910 stop:2425 length:516 start_codon:yes stop_codon:yes gene_type:complete
MPENKDIEELKKELSKLQPKARLKRLKELEEKRKSEIVDIDGLIKDSEKELKTDEVAEEIAPQQDEINIGRLFEEESGQLEGTVRKEAPETESDNHDYMSFKQVYSDYSRLQDIAYSSMMGNLTPSQADAVDRIGERLDRTKYQSASKEVANILVASKAALYKIKKYAGLE